MRHRYLCISIAVLLSALPWLSACRSDQDEPGGGRDANTIVSEMMGHFRAQTYISTVNISKVYKNNLRYDDVLRVYSKVDENERVRVLLRVKPQGERKGTGLLAELQNKQVVSAYRFIPETKRVVEINPRQDYSNVVIGGLSLQDFQIVQGVSPFSEMRVSGREEVNGKKCYKLDVTFSDQSRYQRGELYATVDERLPVLLRAFNKGGALVKEVTFDKLEQRGGSWVVKQLTVLEKDFDYTSTFTFEDVQINQPIDESVFTIESLQEGWRDGAA